MNVRLLVSGECPAAAPTRALLRDILIEEGLPPTLEEICVENRTMAETTRFLGSPTVQINGYDIEPSRRLDSPRLSCRVYTTASGTQAVPPAEMIRAAVRRGRAPKTSVLFLCTGNSCRSQMAEGWVRALWGDCIEAYSAGIETHGLNPNAVKVMAEAGVDISTQCSECIEDLLGIRLDCVVTVCAHAHETCPVFPTDATVVHVGFDDPPKLAAEATTTEGKLDCYRRVRDEIRCFAEGLPQFLAASCSCPCGTPDSDCCPKDDSAEPAPADCAGRNQSC